MEKEIRHINAEVRKTDANTVEGYALTFNQAYQVGGFWEQITPDAMNGVIERSDVYALLDHNFSRGILARSNKGKGSLQLQSDEQGLKYEFKSGKSALHQELQDYLDRGEINASSFGFTVAEGGDTWEKMSDGKYLRTINQFDLLWDVSPVFTPANPNTTVSARSLDKLKELQDKELLEIDTETEAREKQEKQKADEKQQQEYQKYIDGLAAKYLK